MRYKISDVNKFIVLTFTLFNAVAISYTVFFHTDRWFLYCVIALNFVICWYFIFLNARYWNEYENLLAGFTHFMRYKNIKVNFAGAFEEFDENARFLSLMKRTYVEQNLLKKDYNDLKNVYEKFIPKKIHDEIGFQWYEKIVLWTAVTKEYTIMFLDIKWFSTMCEEIHDPYRTLLLLNIYFDGIGSRISKYGGYIDKYLGDGILAIFDGKNTDNCISAAIDIQEYIKTFQQSAIWKQIHVWIGINRWRVTLWTIGTEDRMEATVIGQAVNITAWLEKLTRIYNAYIIISETAFNELSTPSNYSINFLSEESIKWRQKPIKIYIVNGYSENKVSEEIIDIV